MAAGAHGRCAAHHAGLHAVPPLVLARRQSDDAGRDAARRVGLGREPHAGARRRRAAQRSVRQLGLLEPHPAGGGRPRRSGARRDRRSLRRRRAGRRHPAADLAADRTRARATIDGGSHDTFRGSLFGGWERNGWTASGAYEGVTTDGVYVVAPEVRGPVDTRADSDYQTGFFTAGRQHTAWNAWTQGRALHRGARQRHAAAGEHHRLAAVSGTGGGSSAAASARRTASAARRTTTRRSRRWPPVAPASV